MQEKAQDIKVGIFVSIGLLLTIVSIVLLGGDRFIFTSYSNLYIHFEEVQGLAKGSVVSLSGIPIGNVEDIDFGGEKDQLVATLSIQTRYLKQITEGSTADIRTQGALGDKYIYIKPGPQTTPPLKDGSFIQREASRDILDIISSRSNSVDKVFDIITDLSVITAQLREANLAGGLAQSSQALNSSLNDLKQIMGDLKANTPQNQELRKSITHLANIMQKIDSGSGSLGALINDPSVHNRLKAMLGGSERDQFLKGLMSNSVKKYNPNDTEGSR